MRNWIIILILFTSMPLKAQITLPPGDLQIKFGGSVIEGEFESQILTGFDMSTMLNIHLNKYLSAGFFWSKSLKGDYLDEGDAEVGSNQGVFSKGFSIDIRGDAKYQSYGIGVRVATGRAAKFRPYFGFRFVRYELVNEMDGMNFSDKSSGIGIDVGLMLRLSDKIHLNLFNFSMINLSDGIYYMGDGLLLLEASIGLTYNFGKRK